MNIHALKLELVQRLVSTDDATVLTKVKRLLDLLRARPEYAIDEHDEELLAAANLFAATAYDDDEPDISGLELKEPNPNYGG